ncbi:MAG: hypothetical protein V4620_04165 [Bacteroidota bacterium]
MFFSLTIILITLFIFIKAIKLPSFIPTLLSILPLQQSIFICYAYFFKDGLFAEYFIHNDILNDAGIYYILINYCLYAAFIYGISFLVLKKIRFNNNSLQWLQLSSFSFSLEKLIIVYLGLSMLFLTSTALDGFIPKVTRIAYSYMSFVPILVGYFIKKLERKIVLLFFIVVGLFVGVNLLAGGRGYLVTIVISFTLGLLANKENYNLRRKYFITIGIIAVLAFPLLSFIEQFRTDNERVSFEEVDGQRLNSLVSEYKTNTNSKETNNDGIARLITWPTLSVILLTDVTVPTVGFSNIGNDLQFIYTNTFITGKGVEESREQYIENLWGSSPSNLYDYNVNLSNSVEFSLMADGIWRYGQLGFFYNLIIIILIALLIENYIVNSISTNNISSFKLFILGNTYLIMYNSVGAEPLISIARSLIYNMFFSFLFSKIIDFYLHKHVLRKALNTIENL